MKNIISSLLAFALCWNLVAQDSESEFVFQTFKATRIVNMHSTEMLPKNTLDIRIGHKFGDFLGDNGGWSTFYGLENAADILIGAEYGITDNIAIGLSRVKGAGPIRQNLAGSFKYRFLRQEKEGGMPLTMTFIGLGTLSTQEKIDDPTSLRYFDKFAHRMSYSAQILIARKFGDRFSLLLSPGYIHRNIIQTGIGDTNGIFYLGAGARLQMTKVLGLIADVNFPFSEIRTADNGYYPSLGIGLEIDTGGHIFQINFTNATGILETDYIPYTRSNWADGEFRLSFGISRVFNL